MKKNIPLLFATGFFFFLLPFATADDHVMVPNPGAGLKDNGDGTVTQIRHDGVALMWFKDANYAQTSGYSRFGTMTHDNALGWIDFLNKMNEGKGFAGYNDWRLPVTPTGEDDSISEMAYMYSVELENIIYPENGWGLKNTGPFENLMAASYWSSTKANPNLAYFFNFAGIGESFEATIRTFYAWPVRNVDPKGDLDGDFDITLKDAILALDVCLGTAFDAENVLAADVNKDGKLGISETVFILEKIAGLR